MIARKLQSTNEKRFISKDVLSVEWHDESVQRNSMASESHWGVA